MSQQPLPSLRWAAARLPRPLARASRAMATATTDDAFAAGALEFALAAADTFHELASALTRAQPEPDPAVMAALEQASPADPRGRWQAAIAAASALPTAAAGETGSFARALGWLRDDHEDAKSLRAALDHWLERAHRETLSRGGWSERLPELLDGAAVAHLQTMAGLFARGALTEGLGAARVRLLDVWPTNEGAAAVARVDHGWGHGFGPLTLALRGPLPPAHATLWIDLDTGLAQRTGARDAAPVALTDEAQAELIAALRDPRGAGGAWEAISGDATRLDAGGLRLELVVAPAERPGWHARWWSRTTGGGAEGSALALPHVAEWRVGHVRALVDVPGDVTLSERGARPGREDARRVTAWLRDALAGGAELVPERVPNGREILLAGADALVCPLLGGADLEGSAQHAGGWAASWLERLARPEPGLDALIETLWRAESLAEAFDALDDGRARLSARIGGMDLEASQRLADLQARLDPAPEEIGAGDEPDALATAAIGRWDAGERAGWLSEAARAFEEAGREPDAEAAWEMVLDADPSHAAASAFLESQARRAGNLALCLELLTERAEGRDRSPAVRVDALTEAAVVATELGDRERALQLAEALAATSDEELQKGRETAVRVATAHADWERATRWALAQRDAELSRETAAHVLAAAGAATDRAEARRLAAMALALDPALADEPAVYESLRPPAELLQTASAQTPEQRRARLEARLDEATDDATRASLLAILVDEAPALGLVGADLALYQMALLEHRPQDPALLEAVQRVRAAEGNWREVERLLERRSRLVDGPGERRQLGLERARVLRRRLGRNERALVLLNELCREFPGDAELLAALEDVCRALSRWEPLLEAQVQRAALIEGRPRADLLVEAAAVAHHQLDSEARARALYADALAIIPDHPAAAREYGALLRQAGQVDEAMPWLEIWAGSVHAAVSPEEALAAQLALAEAAEAVSRFEAAVAAYDAVVTIDPEHVDALLAGARLHRELGHTERAERALRQLLALSDDKLDDRAKAVAERELSELSLESGSLEESRAHLLAAHRADPSEPELLRRLVEVSDQMQRWADAIAYRLQLAELTRDSQTQYLLFAEAGELARRRLSDDEMAMTTYERAHRAQPDARAPLGILVELYLAGGRYADAGQALERLVELEPDPKKKAQNALATALLYRDHLGDHAQAVVFLERALEHDPLRLEAFEALDQLLAGQERYDGERAQAYERMIQRLDGVDDSDHVVVKLLINLGRLCATTGRSPQAEAAFRRAAVYRPQDPQPLVLLGELYASQDEGSEGSSDKAAEAFRRALALGSREPAIFRALRKTYTRQRAPDAAWCTCGVLVHLNAADEKERTYYEAHKTGALKVARTLRDFDLWRKHLYADPQVEALGALFETLYQSMPQIFRTHGAAQPRIRASSRVDLDEQTTFTGFATTVPRILGVATPRYFRAPQQVGVAKRCDPDPVLWVAPELVDHGRGKPLRFALGRAVALFHEPLWVHELLPPVELQRLLEALYALVTSGIEPTELRDNPWLAQLDAMVPAGSRPALQALAAPHFRAGAVPDVRRWSALAQQTANRVGLLLCNDVEVAAAGVASDPKPECGLSVDEQIWDLLRYATSPPYHRLREHLGIAVR